MLPPMPAPEIERVLVVEDNASLRRALERALAASFPQVRAAGSAAEARAELGEMEPELLLLDVELPDGNALDLMREAAQQPWAPIVVAMSGSATPNQSFELATLGVRAFLPKPLELETLEQTLRECIESPPDLVPQVRTMVGQRPIHEVEEEVRRTMLREALARAGGSRRGAARLLAVSRQLIQHMLRRHEDL